MLVSFLFVSFEKNVKKQGVQGSHTILRKMPLTESNVALNAVKKLGFENCANLQKVILSVNFDVVELSMSMKNIKNDQTRKTVNGKRNLEEGIATVKKLVFDSKAELDSFSIEHLDTLAINEDFSFTIPAYRPNFESHYLNRSGFLN